MVIIAPLSPFVKRFSNACKNFPIVLYCKYHTKLHIFHKECTISALCISISPYEKYAKRFSVVTNLGDTMRVFPKFGNTLFYFTEVTQ